MVDPLAPLLADGVIDEVVARLKSGKEADLFIVRHRGEALAAKVYKLRAHRSFRNLPDDVLRSVAARGGVVCVMFAVEYLGGRTLGHLANPKDVEKAALDHPDFNFVVYHSALQHSPTEPEFKDPAKVNPVTGDMAWHNVLMDIKKRNPKLNNVYPEIGSFFGPLLLAIGIAVVLLGAFMFMRHDQPELARGGSTAPTPTA